MSKLRTSVIDFVKKSSGTHAQLNHLTSMEINSIRSLLPDSLDVKLHMNQNSHPAQSSTSQSFDTTL